MPDQRHRISPDTGANDEVRKSAAWDAYSDGLLAHAVPEAKWIHYAHPRCEPVLTGADYRRLGARFPEQFIGSKLSCANVMQLTEILIGSPELAHFVTDQTMGVGMMIGAKGCYSYWVNTLPSWHQRYMDACLAKDWVTVGACHKKLIEWELMHTQPLREVGHRHGIVGKARATLSDFLEDTGHTRPPYYPVPFELQREYKAAFDAYWAEEIAVE